MIAIIGAMQIEVDEICKIMDSYEIINENGKTFYKGTLDHEDVILMLSGVGKGNAACSTTMLMEKYHPGFVLNIGTAGGLLDTQNILDICVSDSVVQHDYDTSPIDGKDGIGLRFNVKKETVEKITAYLSHFDGNVHVGCIASGDKFISDEKDFKNILNNFPDSICCEMEAGAIAQVCTQYNVDYVVIRSLSDVVFKEDSHMDFMEYARVASARSAKFCKFIIKKLKQG